MLSEPPVFVVSLFPKGGWDTLVGIEIYESPDVLPAKWVSGLVPSGPHNSCIFLSQGGHRFGHHRMFHAMSTINVIGWPPTNISTVGSQGPRSREPSPP